MALIHGGDIFTLAEKLNKKDTEIMDFSVNINPLGLSPKVKKALIEHIDLAVAYPDPLCRKLIAALSQQHQMEKEHILCGNGAADLIFRLAYVCQPKHALILAPTFAEYELALSQVGCEISYYNLKEETDYKVEEDLLELLTPDLDMIWICNPNNPTGQLTPKSLMLRLLRKCEAHNIQMIVDECFMDFIEEDSAYSMIEEVEKSKHVTILKAFTKFYGMAGLRLGYALIGDKVLKDALQKAAQPWAVSSLAQLAGVAALEDIAYKEETLSMIKAQRTYLKEALKRLGFRVYASYADYLFFKSPILDLHKQLANEGILIRHCGNYRGLSAQYYRIGIKTPQMNTFLIQALEKCER